MRIRLSAAPPGVKDCWNEIGVRGNASCPLLAQHSHCHRCPTHATAARRLLDRNIAADHLAGWAERIARPAPVEESRAESAVIFRIGVEWLALTALVLDEVAVQRPAHCLPHRRSAVVIGLVNVRGALLICVSLARLLGVIEGSAGPAQNPSATAAGRLVVLRHASGRLTFPADEVHGCHRYRSCDLQPPPATLATAATAYIKAVLMWSDRLVGLLDHQVVIPALIDSLA